MATTRKVVYVDTNVIIEATRTGCWKAILNQFEVRTVEEVRREALHIPANRASYVPIDAKLLADHVRAEKVAAADVLSASIPAPRLTTLDAGERDLLAHLAGRKMDAWLLTTADRAAVKTACELKLDSKLISLEELAGLCGQKPNVSEWFTKKWLGGIRAEFLFDNL
jgi:predicted nucleic acid-binding protein